MYTASPGTGSGEIQHKEWGKLSCITSYANVTQGRVQVSSANAVSLLNMSLAPTLCFNESAVPETPFLIVSTLSAMVFFHPTQAVPSLPWSMFPSQLSHNSCLLMLPHTSTSFRTVIGGSEPESLNTLAELMETRHQWVLHPLEGLQPVKTNICEN